MSNRREYQREYQRKLRAAQGAKPRNPKSPDEQRTKQLLLRVSSAEFAAIAAKASELDISKTELVVRAVEKYQPEDSET